MSSLFIDRSERYNMAEVKLKNGETLRVPMRCEFIIATAEKMYGRIFDIQSIALWADRLEELGEYLSIGGPTRWPQGVEYGLHGGVLTGLEVSLYYPLLDNYDPSSYERDIPLMEYLEGEIYWRQNSEPLLPGEIGEDNPDAVESIGIRHYTVFTLELRLSRGLVGEIEALQFESPPMFEWHEPLPDMGSRSLRSELASLTPYNPFGTKTLNVRFVAVNAPGAILVEDPRDREPLRPWITNWLEGVQEVWTQKDNLCLNVQPEIDFWDEAIPVPWTQTPGRLSIYLVNNLAPENNGGVKYPPNSVTSASYLILQVDNNTLQPEYKYLLAHELGHIFGLKHPEHYQYGAPEIFWRGAYGSIMLPGDFPTPLPSRVVNPLSNLQLLAQPNALAQISAILWQNAVPEAALCRDSVWKPDPEPWYVWATHQALGRAYDDFNRLQWNYGDLTLVRPEADHLDTELDPRQAHLCIRLSDLQLMHRPVTAHLFLMNDRELHRLSLDSERYFLTFYRSHTEEQEKKWAPLKLDEVIADLGRLAGLYSDEQKTMMARQKIRIEFRKRVKTRSRRWEIAPNLRGDYTLVAVVVDSDATTPRDRDEQELINLINGPLTDPAHILRVRELFRLDKPNLIKLVQVSLPPIPV